MKAVFPGLRLGRPKGDLCDRCVRIELELCSPDLTAERKQFLEEEKKLHVDEAITQRRVWSNFIRDYAGKVDPNLVIPADALTDLLPDDAPIQVEEIVEECKSDNDNDSTMEGNLGEESSLVSSIQLLAEDYGGGIALPHYGFRRPSSDYFNSNLMTYNFVMADITGNVNNVYFYDERHQGKGADALCSLR